MQDLLVFEERNSHLSNYNRQRDDSANQMESFSYLRRAITAEINIVQTNGFSLNCACLYTRRLRLRSTCIMQCVNFSRGRTVVVSHWISRNVWLQRRIIENDPMSRTCQSKSKTAREKSEMVSIGIGFHLIDQNSSVFLSFSRSLLVELLEQGL